ncbi:Pectinesterase [Melia azedarach]|uniref:Pectinesterase n=1 Tax=Melia azedarach TaxID=155640 RepID=A0ACC1YBB9_MELAZ|nr:Pectinesterase [Melia azedarach]
MSSFQSYGKVNEAEQARLQARRKTRRRIAIISLSSIALVAVVVATVVGVTRNNSDNEGSSKNGDGRSISGTIKAVCDETLYKNTCYDSLSNAADNSRQLQPEDLLKLAIKVASAELSKVSKNFGQNSTVFSGITDKLTVAALQNCGELLSLALDHLEDSLKSGASVLESFDDLKTWLSSAVTYQETCLDGLEEAQAGILSRVSAFLKNSGEMTSNSLAIVSWFSKVANSVKLRRLMSYSPVADEKVPDWLRPEDRKLLGSPDIWKNQANAVVAKDGTGKYRTISAALKAVPNKSKKRFIIYVKKGVYVENLRVEKQKWNVMMIGDGMNATIVSGSRNFVDGTPTFSSATFAVLGQGFVARDMGFRNTAGAIKHQAVALMSTADHSVFYRCQMDAFQDTLYAHSNRQFYGECNIYGTVDFIFGNSAVVLQNCNIFPRQPMRGQKNTITAQGKKDPNQNTGISIQNCTISPFGDLRGVETYLGRPWKDFSTTIFMHSAMGSLIHPNGWLPWIGTSAPSTIFYAEFQNKGPGSTTKQRVKWKGLRSISIREAGKFTVKEFLQGEKWISDAGVSYKPGL